MRYRALPYSVASVIVLSIFCSPRIHTPEGPFAPAFLSIEAARNEKPVDFAVIDSLYSLHLKDSVCARDSAACRDIVGAIISGARGTAPHVQSQIVSKTLQKVFFNDLHARLSSQPFPLGAAEYARIADLYECLRPTVVRRSRWIGGSTELDEACVRGLKQVRGSGRQGAEDGARILLRILVQVYALSVFYELEGIEKHRGSNPAVCEEKAVEGRIFFETIRRFSKETPFADSVAAAFGGDYEKMDIGALRLLMGRMFPEAAAARGPGH